MIIPLNLARFIKDQDMQLCLVTKRYGGGFLGFLTYQADAAKEIVECLGGADHYAGLVDNYFLKNPWFPMVSAVSFESVIAQLEERVTAGVDKVGAYLFRQAVAKATGEFTNFSDTGFSNTIYSPLDPDFEGYVKKL